MSKQDFLWKGLIEDFFSDFLKFFFNEYVHLIDLDKGFEFLDKELRKIFPKSIEINRNADQLVKVYLKTGSILQLLIHIEVQGYSDEEFDKRMYVYQYRVFDKMKTLTAAIAIYTDNSQSFHPKKFEFGIFDTRLKYQFRTYKILEKKLSDIRRHSSNPFSIIVELAWWGLKKNNLTEKELMVKKIEAYKKLLKLRFSKEQIGYLFDFIKYYQPLKNSELNIKFDKTINKLSNNETMGIREALLEHSRLEGMGKGIEKGEERTLEIIKCLKAGESVKVIAKRFGVDEEKIIKIQKTLEE